MQWFSSDSPPINNITLTIICIDLLASEVRRKNRLLREQLWTTHLSHHVMRLWRELDVSDCPWESSSHSIALSYGSIEFWLVVEPYPSEKWWTESQLGWFFHSQLNGKIIQMFQTTKPPTRVVYKSYFTICPKHQPDQHLRSMDIYGLYSDYGWAP